MRRYDGPFDDPWDDDRWVASVADPEFDAWHDEQAWEEAPDDGRDR